MISDDKQEAPSESHFLMSVKVSENKSVHAHDATASRQPGAGVMRTELPSERNATPPDLTSDDAHAATLGQSDFVPATKFLGARHGAVFKIGARGLG